MNRELNLEPNEFLKIWYNDFGQLEFKIVGFVYWKRWPTVNEYSITYQVTDYAFKSARTKAHAIENILYGLAGMLEQYKYEQFGVRY